jgi:hypothetical protein
MLIHGPRLTHLETRADDVSDRVTRELTLITDQVVDWYHSFDDINLARGLWNERVGAVFLPLVLDAYDDSADDTWRRLTKIGDDAQPALTAALIPKSVSRLAEGFIDHVKRRLTDIGDMLWNAMRTQLMAGVQLGETTESLRQRLRAASELVAPRARNVAADVIVTAMNTGSFTQMKAAKVVALKTWATRHDDRVRASHEAVDGTQVDIDGKFIVGGHAMDYPHDLAAPIEETINCRCTLTWEIVKRGQLTDELVVRSLTADGAETFHLPGQHNQKTHGRRTGARSNATAPPKLKVMPQLAVGWEFASGDEPWVFDSDPDKRAVGIWASSFNGMDAVRQVMRNRAAGRSDFADFEFSSKRFERTVLQMPDYTEADLKNDVLAAAMNLQDRLDNARTNKTRLYRGMRMSADDIPSVGFTFDQDVASWTANKGWAALYSDMDDEYHRGDVAVMMRLEGSHKSVDIDGDLPNFMRDSQEHLAGGRYRVKSVTGSGKRRTIVVEEVTDEV